MQDMHAPYLVEGLCLEARGRRPIVILREVFRRGDGSSEEAPPQGAVSYNADAQLAAGGDDLSLRVPADTFRQGFCLQRCLFLGCQAVLQTSSRLEGMISASESLHTHDRGFGYSNACQKFWDVMQPVLPTSSRQVGMILASEPRACMADPVAAAAAAGTAAACLSLPWWKKVKASE